MAITVQRLCEKSNYLYGMRVIAGEKGMKNIVQWVHAIEDSDASEFLHGGELIFTTGIAHQGNEWLLPFIKKLKEKEVTGLVINFGPYISEVSKEVQDYCSEIAFPLLEVPWKTRLVDITRDFCNQIIQSEQKEADIGKIFENLVFYPQDVEKYIPTLELNDFTRQANYCIVGVFVEIEQDNETIRGIIKLEIERRFYYYKEKIGCFTKGQEVFFVLCGYENTEIEAVIEQIQQMEISDSRIKKLYIGVGSNKVNLEDLSKNYNKTLSVLRLSIAKKNSPLFYDQFGMKKILLSVEETDVLEDYYKKKLGKLEVYDREHGTDYITFLKKYLEFDGSVQRLAEDTFVHRNTVNYQLNKIKKILGSEIGTLEERFEIMLSYQIKDIL
ncbi:MAG: PucR family transcriptional regulator [Lachnotalea sp.]